MIFYYLKCISLSERCWQTLNHFIQFQVNDHTTARCATRASRRAPISNVTNEREFIRKGLSNSRLETTERPTTLPMLIRRTQSLIGGSTMTTTKMTCLAIINKSTTWKVELTALRNNCWRVSRNLSVWCRQTANRWKRPSTWKRWEETR